MTNEDIWRDSMTNQYPANRLRRLLRPIPSNPRCKLCYAPFAGPGGMVMKLTPLRPSRLNPTICNHCERQAKKYPGGAEVPLAMLFADIRGSSGLAERMSPADFSRLVNRFYSVATDVLVETSALIDKLVGDEVIAFFFPSMSGQEYPRVAIQAGRDLLRAVSAEDVGGYRLPVGVGVHAGTAYFGTVQGAEGMTDLTALGDSVNTTSRLASLAGAGELLISEAIATLAGIDTTGLERRELELRGRSEPVAVWVEHVDSAVAAA
jgi:adenylate cyclase